MQVKVCPKCEAENKESNSACSSCYGSLDGVPLTESTKQEVAASTPQQPVQPPPPKPEQPAGQPPSPYGPPPTRPVGGPPMRERPQPVKQGPNVGGIVFTIIILAAVVFAGWWFFLKPASPEQVVLKFIDAAKTNDIEKYKQFLTHSGFVMINAQQKLTGPVEMNTGSANAKVKILGTTYEGADKSTALVKVEPEDKSKMPPGIDANIEFVLVKEEGKWKIDLQKTSMRMMQKVFSEMKMKGLKMPPGAERFMR